MLFVNLQKLTDSFYKSNETYIKSRKHRFVYLKLKFINTFFC